jgi:hypothetical protein
MTIFEKISTALGIFLLLIVVGFFGAYLWSRTPPSRPKGIASTAVFLWAPNVGVPAPRRGWWLWCRYETNDRDYCTLSDIDGHAQYDGEFIVYGTKAAVAGSELKIDPEKSIDHKVWVGNTLVPLVYLRNGDVLIPKESYDAGVKALE